MARSYRAWAPDHQQLGPPPGLLLHARRGPSGSVITCKHEKTKSYFPSFPSFPSSLSEEHLISPFSRILPSSTFAPFVFRSEPTHPGVCININLLGIKDVRLPTFVVVGPFCRGSTRKAYYTHGSAMRDNRTRLKDHSLHCRHTFIHARTNAALVRLTAHVHTFFKCKLLAKLCIYSPHTNNITIRTTRPIHMHLTRHRLRT